MGITRQCEIENGVFLGGYLRLLLCLNLNSKYLCLVDKRGGEENDFEVFEAFFWHWHRM